MHKKTTLAGILILLGAALLLAACSAPSSPAAPTGDANAVYTQAAASVSAGLTQTAEKNPAPTETPAPPTATATVVSQPPTATIEQPGPNNAPTATTAAGNTQPTATTAANQQATPTKANIVPTATKAAAPPAATGDKATWVSQSPADKTKIQKSATFTMTYVIKNTGTTTWTTNYSLRFYAGNQMGSPNDTNLTRDVAPGESATITFTMIAPDTTGNTNTVWVMSNADGANFYSVNLDLEITD